MPPPRVLRVALGGGDDGEGKFGEGGDPIPFGFGTFLALVLLLCKSM